MYSVSEAFKVAMKKAQRVEHVKGTVGSYAFTDSNLISLSYSNRCSDTKDVTFGSAYIGQIEAQFVNMPITRGEWRGQTLTLQYGLTLADSSVEYIPIGTFIISEAIWSDTGVSVTAYDVMSLLDVAFNATTTEGNIYGMLSLIASITGVSLGRTAQEIAELPNGAEMLGLYPENDVSTCRDLVSWVANTIGGFATADREGKLTVKSFAEAEVVDTLEARDRIIGSTFSDYSTSYDGISIHDNQDGLQYYYAEDTAPGISIALGSNPLLQYGVEETKTRQRQALAEVAHGINYTPFGVSILNCPVYDLGDLVECSGGVAGSADLTCCVMSIEWSFKNTLTLNGYGTDPNLTAGKTKTDKALAQQAKQQKSDGLTYYTFVNTTAVSLDTTANRLYRIAFATADKTTVDLWHEVKWDIETNNEPVEITYEYYLDGEKIDYEPVETWDVDGYHTVAHPYWLLDLEGGQVHHWEVRAKLNSGSATASIGDIHAELRGQKLVGKVKFDGNLELEDEYTPWDIGLTVISLADSLTITRQGAGVAFALSDSHSPWVIGQSVVSLADSCDLKGDAPIFNRITQDGDSRVTVDGDQRVTSK